MISVQTITLGVLEAEDRLLLDFGLSDATESVLLTRRLTRRLIAGIAKMLARPSALLDRVPSCHQTEMLVWEHISARQTGGSAQGGGAARPPRPPLPWPLLTRLDVQSRSDGFHLRFEAEGGLSRALVMTRTELHRLLATLRQLARLAEWDLDGEVDWLAEADSPTLQPGSWAS